MQKHIENHHKNIGKVVHFICEVYNKLKKIENTQTKKVDHIKCNKCQIKMANSRDGERKHAERCNERLKLLIDALTLFLKISDEAKRFFFKDIPLELNEDFIFTKNQVNFNVNFSIKTSEEFKSVLLTVLF